MCWREIEEIDRWRVCQGRHIKELVGFGGQRACDRRLRKLVQAGYISREKILYGVAGIYRITSKGAKLEGLGNSKSKIRIEQIRHDIAVLDTAIYIGKVQEIEYKDIRTERIKASHPHLAYRIIHLEKLENEGVA